VTNITPSLEAESVLRTLGKSHALKGEWKQAAERFNLLLQADQKDNSFEITDDLLMAGPIQIEHGDMEGYERFRRAAVAHFASTTDPIFAERTLKISLLSPADAKLMESLEPLSDVSAKSMVTAGKDPLMEAWRCISLGLMAYRQGDLAMAKTWCQKCLSYPQNNPSRIATAHVIQAMACYKSGDVETARSELEQGRDMINAEFAKAKDLSEGNGAIGFWFDWLFARILLRETETMMDSSPAAKS
jgi:hypothetical protein